MQPQRSNVILQVGMTLIELLIVIAILGVIAAIGAPTLIQNIRVAKNAEAQNTLKSIFLMQKNYYLENYCYYITPNQGDYSSNVNQYLLNSVNPALGPIQVGVSNDFYFYILPGPTGVSGTCTGSNSNDYLAYAQSKSIPTLRFSIDQQNIRIGF